LCDERNGMESPRSNPIALRIGNLLSFVGPLVTVKNSSHSGTCPQARAGGAGAVEGRRLFPTRHGRQGTFPA
jgi:hypothetical protein